MIAAFAPSRETVALVLGAHPDDEMGCAGLIARLTQIGATIHHAYFSTCAISTIARGHAPGALLEECAASRATLGIAEHNCHDFDFPVREFPAYRQSILDALIGLRNSVRPNLVLTACRADFHQDHSTLTAEAVRAFKHTTILGYELPWNCPEMQHDVLIRLEAAHVETKIAAIGCYKTQAGAPYVEPEFIRSLARVRGIQCGADFAECYELIRCVV
jgi:N-acetylglucosamine malate deacetylase 1